MEGAFSETITRWQRTKRHYHLSKLKDMMKHNTNESNDPSGPEPSAILQAAEQYHTLGLNIIPMRYGTKLPSISWSRFQAKRCTQAEIQSWFSNKLQNIALVLGDTSLGIASRDFDDASAYERFKQEQPALAAKCPTIRTARGYQVLFIPKDGSVLSQTIHSEDGSGELRVGKGSLIILPPSKHPSGVMYEWVNELAEDIPRLNPYDCGLANLGSGQLMRPQHNTVNSDSNSLLDYITPQQLTNQDKKFLSGFIGEGSSLRNKSLFDLACNFKGNGVPYGLARAELEKTACEAGLSNSEIVATIDSAYSKERNPSIPNNIVQIPSLRSPRSIQRDIGSEIDAIRSTNTPPHEKIRSVAETIYDKLRSSGQMYHTDRGYFYRHAPTKTLMRIHKDDESFCALLFSMHINRAERNCFEYVLGHVQMETRKHGQRATIRHTTHFEWDTLTLYFHSGGDDVFVLTDSRIKTVKNGTDGVLFEPVPDSTPFKLLDIENFDDPSQSKLNELLFESINFASGTLTPNEQRTLFVIWFLMLPFKSIMPTKPILAMIGERGCGKTVAIRNVLKTLFGPNADLTSVPGSKDDFDVTLSANHLVGIDNADSVVDWIEDSLATAATGASNTKRKLYTDAEIVTVRLDCFVAITSRTPQFKRDDVANRMLTLRLESLGDKFVEESFIQAEIQNNRDRIMTEALFCYQKVIQCLKKKHEEGWTYKGNFRMADFAGFAMRVASIIGEETRISDILDKLTVEQNEFAAESEPLIAILSVWLENPIKIGQEFTSSELLKELKTVASTENIRLTANTAQKLGMRLGSRRTLLTDRLGMRTRKVGKNKTVYSFHPVKGGDEDSAPML